MNREQIEKALDEWTTYQNILMAELAAIWEENPTQALKNPDRRQRIQRVGIVLTGAMLKHDELLQALVELHEKEVAAHAAA